MNKIKKLTPIQELLVKTLLYQPESVRTVLAGMYQPKRGYKFLRMLFTDRVGIEIDMQGMSLKGFHAIQKYNKDNYRHGMEIVRSGNDYLDLPLTQMVEFRMSFKSINQLKNLKSIMEVLKKDSIASLPVKGGIHIHCNLPKDSEWHNESHKRYWYGKLDPYFSFIIGTIFGKPLNDYDKEHRITESSKISVYRHYESVEYRAGTPTFNYTKLVKMVLCCSYCTGQLRLNRPIDKSFVKAVVSM